MAENTEQSSDDILAELARRRSTFSSRSQVRNEHREQKHHEQDQR